VIAIRPAADADAPALASIAVAAYQHYVPRIGQLPAPMTADYTAAIRRGQAWVAAVDGEVIAKRRELQAVQRKLSGLIDAIAGEPTEATDQEKPNVPDTEDAIRADPRLGDEQKAALIAVYRSMLAPAPPVTKD